MHTHTVRLQSSFYLSRVKHENSWALAHLSHHVFQTLVKSHDQGSATQYLPSQVLSVFPHTSFNHPTFTAKSMSQTYSFLYESKVANFGIFFPGGFLSPGLTSLLT